MLPDLRREFEHSRVYALCEVNLEMRRLYLEELLDEQLAMLGCGPLLHGHFLETVQICEEDLQQVDYEIKERSRLAVLKTTLALMI